MTDQYPPGPPVYVPPPTRRPATHAPLLLAILLGLIGGWALYRLTDAYLARENARPRVVAPRASLTDLEKTNISVFESASPSVAFIVSIAMRRDLFGLDVQKVRQGAGSGIVWDQNGHIVTNAHVVGPSNGNMAFDITLSDHKTYRGRVIGIAQENDLAVLKISAPAGSLHPITLGTSHDLQVGQMALAIGSPFQLDQTLTTGIISALGRQIPTESGRVIKDVIQTDAAVNPGNSGGPLLDSAGRLIGVNTAIYSPSGASAGIGFAIPVDTVNRVVPQLIEHGKIVRPRLGITPAHDSVARRLGVAGVLITSVEDGSAAVTAGLRGTHLDAQGNIVLGDAITAIDGKTIASVDDLLSTLEKHKVGDVVRLTVMRGEKEMTANAQLQ